MEQQQHVNGVCSLSFPQMDDGKLHTWIDYTVSIKDFCQQFGDFIAFAFEGYSTLGDQQGAHYDSSSRHDPVH